ncbi:protein TIME FOR COFFEE-like isoform X1 [Asparagus officinalis]|uniref:protein TIME FOR COFFEE-like isoform X1 n=1 Tax=Asparagus officinalis TaxID=4686 RepID=UPI00098E0D0E|nr:protein TIME FOR COFFEE-like isoform X1 [Asparagus officinalis]
MDRTRERKMSFSSSRRRSRGMVPKESSGIWKVENEGIDTIRERYRIKDHRLNGRTRHSRLVSNESSDESFDEEMAGGQNGQAVIKDTKLKGYDEIIVGVPVPRRARGLKRRLQNSVVNAQSSNVSKETGDEAVPISETEVEVAKVLFGLTKLHSQDSDAVVDTFQGSSVPDTSALPKGSKGKKFKPLQSDDDEKPSMIITSNSKSDVTIDQLNAGSSVPFPSMNGKLAGISSTIEKVTTSSTKLDKSSSNNSGQSTVETPLLGPQNVVSPTVLAEEKPSPASSIMSQPFMSAIHPGQAKPLLLNKGDEDSNANCKTEHEQSEQLTGKGLDRRKQDLPPQSCQNKNLDRHKGASPVSSVKDCVKKMKYEIDLMALPHGDEVDAINECDPQVSYINQAPLVMLPPTRPNHCATHCYIARLIHFQQQLVKLNPFCQTAGSLGKPYNLSAVPQPGALLLGGPVIRNPNAVINGSSRSSSTSPLNSQYPVPNYSDSSKDAEKGRHLLQQSHQGGFFLFPINQIQSQAAGQKASDLSQAEKSLSKSNASSALALTSTSCSNLTAIPDNQNLTMFKGNNPFLNTPAYQAYIAQQQRPPLPLFHGSSNSSQLYSGALQLTPIPTASCGSSFENCLQEKQILHSPKTLLEAHDNKPEHSRNCGISRSQRTLQNYSLPAGKHRQPLSPLTNQAKELSKANSSSSGGPSELNHFRKQVVVQTNSPISTLSTSVSVASSVAYSDQNKPRERLCSLQCMPKPDICLENTSSRKVTPVHSLIDAAKAHQNSSVHLTFPGSLNTRKPTVSEQALLSSSIGLTTVATVSSVQGAASLPVKSAEQKPAAA